MFWTRVPYDIGVPASELNHKLAKHLRYIVRKDPKNKQRYEQFFTTKVSLAYEHVRPQNCSIKTATFNSEWLLKK